MREPAPRAQRPRTPLATSLGFLVHLPGISRAVDAFTSTAGKALEGAAEPSGEGASTEDRSGANPMLPPAASTPPRKGAGGTLKATLLTQERRPIFSSSHLASL